MISTRVILVCIMLLLIAKWFSTKNTTSSSSFLGSTRDISRNLGLRVREANEELRRKAREANEELRRKARKARLKARRKARKARGKVRKAIPPPFRLNRTENDVANFILLDFVKFTNDIQRYACTMDIQPTIDNIVLPELKKMISALKSHPNFKEHINTCSAFRDQFILNLKEKSINEIKDRIENRFSDVTNTQFSSDSLENLISACIDKTCVVENNEITLDWELLENLLIVFKGAACNHLKIHNSNPNRNRPPIPDSAYSPIWSSRE